MSWWSILTRGRKGFRFGLNRHGAHLAPVVIDIRIGMLGGGATARSDYDDSQSGKNGNWVGFGTEVAIGAGIGGLGAGISGALPPGSLSKPRLDPPGSW